MSVGGTEREAPKEDLPLFSKNPHMVEKVRQRSCDWARPPFLMESAFNTACSTVYSFSPCDLSSDVCSGILSQNSAFQLHIPWQVGGPPREAEDFRGVLAPLGSPRGAVNQEHIPQGCSQGC